MGYHFVISPTGEIYEGRPLEYKGSHVDKNNTGKIGIALIGDYHPGLLDKNKPTNEQLLSMSVLVDTLQYLYEIKNVNVHRDYNGKMPAGDTVCPGETLNDIIKKMYGE